ncbi:hypothetical protein AB9P05_02375 [Roseivirga sp. BDSF3-8]|uniref:hypothetical protein n=1 Tax=Roseivirga sp. BDSF3-8 TaxID=3241598 RepID=UPI0035327530
MGTPDNKGLITIGDSTYTSPAFVTVTRSKQPLSIRVQHDSIGKTVQLHPAVERKFLFTNLCWTYLAPAAYVVDLTNPKRFHYGHTHRIDATDSVQDIYVTPALNVRPFLNQELTEEKGRWGAVISLPYINTFYFRPDTEWKGRSAGFFGLGAGIEFNDRRNRSLRLMATAITDFPVFVPVPIFYEGDYQTYHALYLSLTRQMYLNRLVLGYGLTYGSHTYSYHFEWWPAEDLRLTQRVAGLDLFGGLKLSQSTTIGGRYRPTFYKFGESLYQYESTFSIEIVFTTF